ncbi:MAG TPA: ATP-binding protein, partial [Fimbriimonadaceae bacterium]|nr:ATP-binding protein [Fimbriimonadaceae bacterium]
WERESILSGAVLVVGASDPAEGALRAWLEEVETAVVVAGQKPLPALKRRVTRLSVGPPSQDEQRQMWTTVLSESGVSANGQIDQAVANFSLPVASIREIGANVRDESELWEACRVAVRGRLDDLATRVETQSSWRDLVLPESEIASLREVAFNVRNRMKVYWEWGFGRRCSRGLGITALFAGVSGTGKTLAAEVLANELKLDLYRIDLSSVVSKYIGETEKNLARVFDAAEQSGAVLLFDEADALFGKRTEVRDSHDRYANIEVSYLLQRMEQYFGLAILTTNMKSALDQAFLRRIRFVVNFPFPDASQRKEIWQRIFPDATPLGNLDLDRLAGLNVAGGNIRNIALGAAFLAAESGEKALRMGHIRQAALTEFRKLEKSLSGHDAEAWDE